MGKAQKPRAEIMQMIERVRDGEDAETVLVGRNTGEEEKGDSGDLDERLDRFLGKGRKKRLLKGG